jgi:hypothetical protein
MSISQRPCKETRTRIVDKPECPACRVTLSSVGCLNRMCKEFVGRTKGAKDETDGGSKD